jgi:hypothetical protein
MLKLHKGDKKEKIVVVEPLRLQNVRTPHKREERKNFHH